MQSLLKDRLWRKGHDRQACIEGLKPKSTFAVTPFGFLLITTYGSSTELCPFGNVTFHLKKVKTPATLHQGHEGHKPKCISVRRKLLLLSLEFLPF